MTVLWKPPGPIIPPRSYNTHQVLISQGDSIPSLSTYQKL